MAAWLFERSMVRFVLPCFHLGFLSVRVVNAQRSSECGLVAVYNLLRILRLPGAKGGYRANRARLAQAMNYNPKDGVRIETTKHAIVEELYPGGYTLHTRRPFWNNIPGQLMRAKAPSVAVLMWETPQEGNPNLAHIAIVWKPYNDEVILCANSQVYYKGTVPFWITYESTHWAMPSLPAHHYGLKLIGFWQVVPRN